MRTLSNIIGAVLLLSALCGCYATTSTPPGPSCSQDPNGQGCYPPPTDSKKPHDGGAQ
jgi:hypothetical protein